MALPRDHPLNSLPRRRVLDPVPRATWSGRAWQESPACSTTRTAPDGPSPYSRPCTTPPSGRPHSSVSTAAGQRGTGAMQPRRGCVRMLTLRRGRAARRRRCPYW